MKEKFGTPIAAEMLAGLSKRERDRILAYIEKKEPETAEELRKLIVTLDDVRFISIDMLRTLLGALKTDDLGLALRMAKAETRAFVLDNVSSGMRAELKDAFSGPPLPAPTVQQAYDRVMKVMREMEDQGKILIKREGDEYVD